MSKKDFERLLDQQTKSTSINWEEIRSGWINQVERLYELVDGWLSEYKNRGSLEIQRKTVELTEESLGTYEIQSLELTVGNKKARLTPIGATIIGAYGRVDVAGPAGRSTLLLVPESSDGPKVYSFISTSEEEKKEKQAELDEALEKSRREPRKWKVATEPPNIKYLTLEEDLFFDVLVEVLGGTSSF